jgi:ParB-like chromosome segregation protein Spo0J
MKVLLTNVRPAATALRKVDKNGAKFKEMVSSVSKMGILNPIPAQNKVDEETGEEYIEITDGLHRYSAAIECGLEEIPVHIVELDEVDTLVAQVHANYAKVDTKTSDDRFLPRLHS